MNGFLSYILNYPLIVTKPEILLLLPCRNLCTRQQFHERENKHDPQSQNCRQTVGHSATLKKR